jgi:molybdopterin synthase sulfur carrier subunit
MIRVNVQCFAGARDLTGWRDRVFPLAEEATAADLLEALITAHPALLPWKAVLRLAVNAEYAEPGRTLRDGDSVAVIPPVSGG